MLRPLPARWFEILAARDDATLVLEALARTDAVELEPRASVGLPAALGDVMPLLAQYAELSARHHAYWPPPERCQPSAFPEAPVATLQRGLATIRAWADEAEPVIRALQRGEAEQGEWRLWQRVLPALGPGAPLPSQLAAAGPWLSVRLFVLPAGTAASQALPAAAGAELICRELPVEGAVHLLVAGRSEALQAIAQNVTTLKGTTHALPEGLALEWPDGEARESPHGKGTADANLALHIEQRLAAGELALQRQRRMLAELQQRHDLPRALGDANRLQWLLRHVHALESGELLCWITGWTSDASGDRLARALHDCGARALLRFAVAPKDSPAPLLLHNPRWVRPFELFSRALGMPSSSEADPSWLLAIVVPLMFGYMFGDVGQGLVLAAAGWWYRDRSPVARLLMVGGLSATVFGALFGSVFGLHHLLPALWLHPLDAPLAVLLAPLVGGALLLLLGLGLGALAAGWRGQWRAWLLTDAGLIVIYLGLLATLVEPAAWPLAAAGALHFCVGHALHAGRAAAALSALGEGIEKTLQIMINTLSFARVGAFALAHAGLSSAIVSLMDAADSMLAKALVLVVGNVVVIVLEAMVVGIQTTRLVLFEFFTRFMQGQGRVFRPLPAPPSLYQET